jgi:hypothetical protein
VNAERIRLQAIAARYGLTIATATPVTGGFSGATVWRTVTDDGQCLAIRHVPHDAAIVNTRQDALAELLSGVFDRGVTGIPVPLRPRPADDLLLSSQRKWFVDLPDGRWLVEPWMPGAALPASDMTPARLSAALLALQRFHAAAREVVLRWPPSAAREWFRFAVEPSAAVRRRRSLLKQWTPEAVDKLSERLQHDPEPAIRTACEHSAGALRCHRDRVLQELERFAQQPAPVQPVLRDVWSSHILFTDDYVTGLIDCTATATDSPALDFARLLRSWFGRDHDAFRSAVQLAVSMDVLQDADLALFDILDASAVLLSPMTWLQRRSEWLSRHPDNASSRWTGDQIARLSEVAANVSALAVRPS